MCSAESFAICCDTLLFSIFDLKALENLFDLIKIFELASGLNINFGKGEILGIHIDDHDMNCLKTNLGCKQGYWPTTYLGVPLGRNPKTFSFWQPVIKKIQHKLHSWKYAFISKGGRHTLIYYLSLFKLPNKVAKILELDKLIRDFFGKELEDMVVCIIVGFSFNLL